jgi:hypothetical protein
VLTEENGNPKTQGVNPMESKWVHSSSQPAENLLKTFSASTDAGIRKMIHDVLVSANIAESKINQITINFSSSGIEELAIEKDSVFFKDDFASKYTGESLFLITKLFRTKNAKIELVDQGAEYFDSGVMDALSEGLRFGGKTESKLENKLTIEILNLTYGYEYIPITINRTSDYTETMYLGEYKDITLNSIKTVQTLEGVPYDFFVRFKSNLLDESLLVKVSNVNPTANFRIGNRESYNLKYVEKAGNKVTLSISGFGVSVQ